MKKSYETLLREVETGCLEENYKEQEAEYRKKAIAHADRISKCLKDKKCRSGKYICRQLEDIADNLESQVEYAGTGDMAA